MSECTCDGRERRSGSTPARDATTAWRSERQSCWESTTKTFILSRTRCPHRLQKRSSLRHRGGIHSHSLHRAQIAFALRKICRNRGIGVVYLATNRYSDIPLYNGSGVRLFSLSDPREMTRTLAPYLRSHGWPADSGGTPYTLDNFIVSAIEQVPDC